jgi:hypothetical protein
MDGGPGQMRIGEVLQRGRERVGHDLEDVEELTKIRGRYLAALEAGDWEALPSDAYAKGYLRTYAELLGLDADALVDEYRRQVEGPRAAASQPVGERVLERRRRPGDAQRGSRWWPVALGVLAVVGAILVVGLIVGGDDDGQGRRHRATAADRKRDGNDRKGGGAGGEREGGAVSLRLKVHDPVEVCLVGGGGEALIDGQVLAPGTEEHYGRQHFSLRFPSGFAPSELKLEIAGRKRILPKVKGPAAFRISPPRHLRSAPRPGEGCP